MINNFETLNSEIAGLTPMKLGMYILRVGGQNFLKQNFEFSVPALRGTIPNLVQS